VARVVITSLADADTAKILNDLNKQAGANVADRYDAGFDNLYQRSARMFALPSCRLTSSSTNTLKTTMS
jgi:hypothetical protein